jgi:hypothetical protein
VTEASKPTPAPGEDERVRKALDEINSLLVPNETLEAYAVQRRIFALKHRRSVVAATSGRFIGVTRGLFGGLNPQDVRWQDFKETKINVGIFGADLTIVFFTSPDLAVTGNTRVLSFEGLRKDQAESVFRICQAGESLFDLDQIASSRVFRLSHNSFSD